MFVAKPHHTLLMFFRTSKYGMLDLKLTSQFLLFYSYIFRQFFPNKRLSLEIIKKENLTQLFLYTKMLLQRTTSWQNTTLDYGNKVIYNGGNRKQRKFLFLCNLINPYCGFVKIKTLDVPRRSIAQNPGITCFKRIQEKMMSLVFLNKTFVICICIFFF